MKHMKEKIDELYEIIEAMKYASRSSKAICEFCLYENNAQKCTENNNVQDFCNFEIDMNKYKNIKGDL